jgi:hypothetical protein
MDHVLRRRVLPRYPRTRTLDDMNAVQRYIQKHIRPLIMLDRALCELIGGPPGHTLSGYAYDASIRGLKWAKIWRPTIDRLAVWICHQHDHCKISYEEEIAALKKALDPASYASPT